MDARVVAFFSSLFQTTTIPKGNRTAPSFSSCRDVVCTPG